MTKSSGFSRVRLDVRSLVPPTGIECVWNPSTTRAYHFLHIARCVYSMGMFTETKGMQVLWPEMW